MGKRFRMSTALDVDDVLMECIPYAIKLANEKYQFDPPLSIHEVDHWGVLGTRADVIFEFFKDEEFYKNQPVIKGAREFIHKLSKMTELFISTSIPPEFMGIRAKRIMEEFPEIPPEHIYMGSRKDKLDVDILFDDGMHNVFKSNATYPILMRRPWNQNATGMLAVNNYDEFLKLVELITKSYSVLDVPVDPNVIVLMGPSGSGKTKIIEELLKLSPNMEMVRSYTTKPSTQLDNSTLYKYVSKDEFNKMLDNNELFESTMYGGNGYGTKKKEVEDIVNKGHKVICSMDICGAIALKTNFPKVAMVYIKRNKVDLMRAILEKDIPNDDKITRIIAIEDEKCNQEICDYTVKVTTYKEAAEEIMKLLEIK